MMSRCRRRISIFLPDLRGGGAERLHVNLANDWVEHGYSVEFVLMQKRGELLPLLSPRINVTGLGVDRIRGVILPLRNYLKQSRLDIIFFSIWSHASATIITVSQGVKVVLCMLSSVVIHAVFTTPSRLVSYENILHGLVEQNNQ